MALSRLEKRILALGRSILRAFDSTEAKIERIVTTSLSDKTSVHTRRGRQAEVLDLLSILDAHVRTEAPAMVAQAFDLGQQIADDRAWAKRFERDQSFNAFDREAIRILSNNLMEQLGGATQTVGRRTDDVFRRVGLRTTLETYARTEVPSAFNAGALEARLRQQGLTAFVDSVGRPWTLANYSQMAIHTIRSEAANQGIVNRMLSRGFEIYTINNPEEECKTCEPYVDKEWALTPGVIVDDVEVEMADQIPPYHPQCRCFLTPSESSVRRRREAFAA